MDQETKDVIRPLLECVASLTTKQAGILRILSLTAPEAQKTSLLQQAQENDKRAEKIRQNASSLQ